MCFKNETIKFIKADDSTLEGRVLLKAKSLLFGLVSKEIKKNFRFDKLFDVIVGAKLAYLNEGIDNELKEEAMKLLYEHFPENVLVSYLYKTWAVTLINTSFALDEGIFVRKCGENEEEHVHNRAVIILIVLLHEMAHKKKTVQSHKDNWKKDQGEPGDIIRCLYERMEQRFRQTKNYGI